MKVVLEKHGIAEQNIGSSRAIIKAAYQCGMLNNQEGWLELLDVRNILANIYSDEQSLDVIRRLKTDYVVLFDTLKNDIEREWIDI